MYLKILKEMFKEMVLRKDVYELPKKIEVLLIKNNKIYRLWLTYPDWSKLPPFK